MKKLRLWAGLVTLFLSGVLIGAMGSWIIAERKAVDVLTRGKSGAPGVIVERLTRELELDDSQRKRITQIVCRTHAELAELRMRTRPEKDRILQQSRELMKAELTPGQQEKLDAMFERLAERRARRESAARDRQGPASPCQ